MFRDLKIGTKIVGGFLLVVLVPSLVAAYLSFINAQNALKQAAIVKLETVAGLKEDKFETFFDELRKDLMVAQDYFNVKTNLPIVNQFYRNKASSEYIAAEAMLNSQLKTFQEVKGFEDIMLVNPKGIVVYAIDEGHRRERIGNILPNHSDDDFADEVEREIHINNIFFAEEDGKLEMMGVAPIHDFKGEFTGFVVFEFDVGEIYEIILDTSGLGKSGETLVGRKEGGYALFLNPLRHDKDSALKRKATFGEENAIPIQEAVQGRSGSGITVDYRGEEVIAAWQYIPSLNWGMVAKIDTKEAFAPAVDLRNQTFLITALSFLIILLLSHYLSRSISGPLVALRNITLEVKQGDLTKRAQVKSNDEVGQLAGSFNEMADKLEEAYRGLEEKVSTRTKELMVSNRRLQGIAQNLTIARTGLEKAVAEKGEFLNIAAHELRTPLQPIIGYADRLLHSEHLTSEQKEKIFIVLKSADRLLRLVQDILDINKMETGVMKFASEEVSVARLIKDVHESFKPSVEDKKLQFILDVPSHLGKVRGDLQRLMQVFVNLVGNAVKFTEEGSITIRAKEEKDTVTVAVVDTGVGIDQKYIPKMFTKFFQIEHYLKREHEGTGLGLAICKEIVKAHKGEISVESVLGKGSTFKVVLPKLTNGEKKPSD